MTTLRTDFLIHAGVLIDGSGSTPREDVAIEVADGRFRSVQPWHEYQARSTDIEDGSVWDLSDASVIPGLIDGHTHLCSGSPDSTSWEYARQDMTRTVAWGLASATAALKAGVTTVVDVGSPGSAALIVRELIARGIALGPDVLAAGTAITTTAGHGQWIGTVADTADEMVRSVRRLVSDGVDLIKVMVTGGATDPATNRRRAQYTQGELESLIRDAHRLGRRVVGHANATEGIISAVAAGIDIVAHCNWLGESPGTVEIDWPTVERMLVQGTYIDLNLQGATRSLEGTDGVPIGWSPELPMPECRWDLLQPVRQRGVGLYLSSDAFGPAIGAFPEDLATAAKRWELEAAELVSLVTSIPAAAMGISHERGTVAAGLRADFCVFDGDLRSNIDQLSCADHVIKEGVAVAGRAGIEMPAVARTHHVEARAQRQLLEEVFTELN